MAQKKKKAMFDACERGDVSVVQHFLSSYPDSSFWELDEDCRTPLYMACWYGHEKIVSMLLSANADIQAKKRNGWTALHIACNEGHDQVVSLLLSSNAGVNVKEMEGWSPLFFACKRGHDKIVSLLLSANADVHARDKDGFTALYIASQYGKEKVVSRLLSASADVNVKEKTGWTPLHVACNEGHEKVVSLLLSANANIQAKSNAGSSPEDVAKTRTVRDLLQEPPQASFFEKRTIELQAEVSRLSHALQQSQTRVHKVEGENSELSKKLGEFQRSASLIEALQKRVSFLEDDLLKAQKRVKQVELENSVLSENHEKSQGGTIIHALQKRAAMVEDENFELKKKIKIIEAENQELSQKIETQNQPPPYNGCPTTKTSVHVELMSDRKLDDSLLTEIFDLRSPTKGGFELQHLGSNEFLVPREQLERLVGCDLFSNFAFVECYCGLN